MNDLQSFTLSKVNAGIAVLVDSNDSYGMAHSVLCGKREPKM
jgi:hypothetical protein